MLKNEFIGVKDMISDIQHTPGGKEPLTPMQRVIAATHATVSKRWNRFCGPLLPILDRSPLSLRVVVFSVAFALPLLLVGYLQSGKRTSAVSYLQTLEQHSRRIDASGPRIVFSGSGALNPPADKDLLIFSTWKMGSLPAPGERTVLLSKAKVGPGPRDDQGFALGLINDQGSLRFMLSWPGPEGARWMRFGEVSVKRDEWFMIALSVRKQRSVGAFLVTLDGLRDKPRVQTLGGFSVDGSEGYSDEPLSIAPRGAGRFLTRLGPSGVLRASDVGGREVEILREIAKAPTIPPDGVRPNQVALLWTGGDRAFGSDGADEFPLVNG